MTLPGTLTFSLCSDHISVWFPLSRLPQGYERCASTSASSPKFKCQLLILLSFSWRTSMNEGGRISTWASVVLQSQDQISVRQVSSHRTSRRALTLILMLRTVIASGQILWYNLDSRTAPRIQTEAETWPEIAPLLRSFLLRIWGTWPKIMLKRNLRQGSMSSSSNHILWQSLCLVKVQAFDEAGLSFPKPCVACAGWGLPPGWGSMASAFAEILGS